MMGKILASTVAAVAGVVCAGLIGLVVGQAPVFHWEMAGLVVAFVAAVGGAVGGAAGAASGNAALGACAGALSGGALFALLSFGQEHPPALTLWGTVTAAAAAAIAGVLGGAIGRGANRTTQAGSPRPPV
jgi:hypothetical protein